MRYHHLLLVICPRLKRSMIMPNRQNNGYAVITTKIAYAVILIILAHSEVYSILATNVPTKIPMRHTKEIIKFAANPELSFFCKFLPDFVEQNSERKLPNIESKSTYAASIKVIRMGTTVIPKSNNLFRFSKSDLGLKTIKGVSITDSSTGKIISLPVS